jgi:hypothetical protein
MNAKPIFIDEGPLDGGNKQVIFFVRATRVDKQGSQSVPYLPELENLTPGKLFAPRKPESSESLGIFEAIKVASPHSVKLPVNLNYPLDKFVKVIVARAVETPNKKV